MHVDAVEQWTGDAVKVLAYLSGIADALLRRMVVIAARTGVHRSYEHETGGVFHRDLCPGDGDFPVFEGLPQHFQYRMFEFGEFVQEKNAVMGQANFSGLGVDAPSDQGDVRDGMVRAPERAQGHEGGMTVDVAGHRMDLGGFQGLFEGKGRQNGGQAAGQHGLARTGRTDHQEIMPGRGGNLQGPFHVFLAPDIGEIDIALADPGEKFSPRVDDRLLRFRLIVEEGYHFPDIIDAVDSELIHHRRFACVITGQDQPLETLFPGIDGNGQGPPRRLQGSVEGQLSHHNIAVQFVGLDLFRGGQNPNGHRQVKG